MTNDPRKLRVLVVEDEPAVARALVRALTRHGFHVDAAASHADSLIQFHPYDCGVFDIDLPDGDGVELAESFVRRGMVRGVVFFSAMDGAAVEGRARKHGYFVHKVDGLAALQRAIHVVLERGAGAAREDARDGSRRYL